MAFELALDKQNLNMWKEDVCMDITDWGNSMMKGMELRKYRVIKKVSSSSVWPENRIYKWKIMENKIGKLLWEQIYRAINARWWNIDSILHTVESNRRGMPHSTCVSGVCWTKLEKEVPGSENTNTLDLYYNNAIINSLDFLENRAWSKY